MWCLMSTRFFLIIHALIERAFGKDLKASEQCILLLNLLYVKNRTSIDSPRVDAESRDQRYQALKSHLRDYIDHILDRNRKRWTASKWVEIKRVAIKN